MDLKQVHNVYFIGIGGIGMSALARYFHRLGCQVSGYDKTETALTRSLEEEGMRIHYVEDLDQLPEAVDLVVYTPAVPAQHQELKFYQNSETPVVKRSQVLGWISQQNYTVAVAGTHGKTTTSSMIAHILHHAKVDCTAFVGGITRNYNTNLVVSETAQATVVEADEFDRSFLTLHPHVAVVTSMDADHLDIYGDHQYLLESFDLFAQQVQDGGLLVYRKGLKFNTDFQYRSWTYAVEEVADYQANGVGVVDGHFVFNVAGPHENLQNLRLALPGRHNVENALAAIAVAYEFGLEGPIIREAIESYEGVKRRFEYVLKRDDLVVIDDYAHHPEELKATISSVRELYPNRKITGVFQPHLYSRTRDFEEEFAQSLALLDELILLEIYPARELPIEGVTSAKLLEKVPLDHKSLSNKANLVNHLADQELEVLLMLGAGDIDTLIQPVRDMLTEKQKANT
ncbi:MAG: UDP-N-acetylmuramate--L-alanine ligase [Salibacteraceae bacterium]